ncbi:MAG: hypothetical protein PVI15_00275 [Chromatiales bacterium]|jgi:hypothetical protein
MVVERKCMRVQVAARGWLHEEWVRDYYPDDLPADWRLAFYANEFAGVLVPADYWSSADWPDTAQWREDVSDRFRFFLELDERLLEPELKARLLESVAVLDETLGGVLVPGGRADVDRLVRDAFGTRAPVYGEPAGGGRTAIWRGPGAPRPCAPVGLPEAAGDPSPRALRQLLESFAECADGDEAWLFAGADMQRLSALREMAGLLGL